MVLGSMVAYLIAGQGEGGVPDSVLRVDVSLVLDEGADYVDETTRRRLPTGKRWRQFGVNLATVQLQLEPKPCSTKTKKKRRD